jgi:catechol 2,3-dioxygenase-like lactoylglutathione lyase family enzyme
MSHHNPLGHISFGVRNYEASKTFYTAVLAPLGLALVYESEASSAAPPQPGITATTTITTSTTAGAENQTQQTKKKPRTLGYGPNEEHELLNLFEVGNDASPPGPGFHLAFNAPSREAVINFYAKALEIGGKDNGPPGLREHYGRDYFAAFVIDPDGVRLEVICKAPVDEK